MQERFRARGIQLPEGAQVPAPGQFQQRGQGTAAQFGGGIRGTIQAIEGDTLVVNTDDGVIKVKTTDTTMTEKNMPVRVGDLGVGEMVIVSGPRNDDGSITARSIMSVRAFRLDQ